MTYYSTWIIIHGILFHLNYSTWNWTCKEIITNYKNTPYYKRKIKIKFTNQKTFLCFGVGFLWSKYLSYLEMLTTFFFFFKKKGFYALNCKSINSHTGKESLYGNWREVGDYAIINSDIYLDMRKRHLCFQNLIPK